jgi:cytosine deaminase
MNQISEDDKKFYKIALDEAKKSLSENGIPIGAVLVKNGKIISKGHNQRVQKNNPIAHGEIDCIEKAGRQTSYKDMTLYTTLSPCMMCSGTIIQFKIPQIVIGENKNFKGNIEFLKKNGVKIKILNDQESIKMMNNFINLHPELWDEDIQKQK